MPEAIHSDQAIWDFVLSEQLAQHEELIDLGSQLRLQLQQTLVADRVVPGGIGMELGPIQADHAHF